MRYGADTSIILRVLTGQPSSLAAIVRKRLESLWLSGEVLDVCDLVVSETYFALQHSYGLTKDRALNALSKLSVHPGFRLSDQVVAALRTENLARAKPGFLDRVIKFDNKLDNKSDLMSSIDNIKTIKDSSGLNSSARRVFGAIVEDPFMTQQGLSTKLDLSRATIATATATLIKLNFIRRAGSKKTGHWEVVK